MPDPVSAAGPPVPAGASLPGVPGNATPATPRRATFGFMREHPAHWLAFAFGAGLAPRAPGTVGTLWGWVSFAVLVPWLGAAGFAALIVLAFAAGWWASTRTAQHMGVADPGAVVWDEVVAFWIVLALLLPAPWWGQLAAFALFRFFDAAKPQPVRWADALFKPAPGQAIGWRQGFGIMLDDLVAAFCTLLFIALWIRLWNS